MVFGESIAASGAVVALPEVTISRKVPKFADILSSDDRQSTQ